MYTGNSNVICVETISRSVLEFRLSSKASAYAMHFGVGYFWIFEDPSPVFKHFLLYVLFSPVRLNLEPCTGSDLCFLSLFFFVETENGLIRYWFEEEESLFRRLLRLDERVLDGRHTGR